MTQARDYELVRGDCLRVLRGLPGESVQCVVTSPPYWGLRDYGVSGQLGLEKTPEEYVARMVEVFREVRRVMRHDATLWMNLGDSYAGGFTGRNDATDRYACNVQRAGRATPPNSRQRPVPSGLKPKDLVGIPWRLAFALQADGWYLRSDIIWHKPNPMPESVRDRPTKAHEYLFLLAKSEKYYYDADAAREPQQGDGRKRGVLCSIDRAASTFRGDAGRIRQDNGHRNKRTVWTIPTQSFKGAHFATYPEKLVEPCVLAGTSAHGCCADCGAPWGRQLERKFYGDCRAGHRHADMLTGKNVWRGTKDVDYEPPHTLGWQPACTCSAAVVPCTVLDPFAGAATTGVVCLKTGRRFLGIELSREYLAMARRRLAATSRQLALTQREAA